VYGETAITTGNDSDNVNINDSEFKGAVLMATGSGPDQITIDANGAEFGPVTTFQNALTVLTGSGDDLLEVGYPWVGDDVVANSTVFFDGGPGSGDQILYLLGTGNVFAIPPTVINFEL
jgi:hypothetical protein